MVWRSAGVRSEYLRVLRFLVTGGLNAGFSYACYAGFLLAGAPLWLATGGCMVFSIFFNFNSYGGLVFGDTALRTLPRFLLFYLGVGGLDLGLLRVLGWAGFGPLLAQLVLLPMLAACGYLGMRNFVFRGKAVQAPT